MKNNTQNPGLIVAIGDKPDGKQGDGDLNAMSQASNVDTVPLDALSMPDDQEQMKPPEVGDQVNYQVAGKVFSIEGNMAKVQRTAINGQDLPGADSETDQGVGSDDDVESQDLRSQAGGMGIMMSVILFLLIFQSAFGQNSSLITSPHGAIYRGSDPLYGLPYFSTTLEAKQTYYVLQAESDVIYSDTNGTDKLTGSGMFTPLNSKIYEASSAHAIGASVTNIFFIADNNYFGSFSGNGGGLTGLTNIPESGVSNLVQDLASVPIVANDEFFDFYAPITNTGYYKLIAFQGTAFSTGELYAQGTAELYKYSLTGTLLTDNATPFAGLPGGIDHLGGIDFYSNAIYSAACYFNAGTVPYTSSNAVIAIYSTNDLSLQSYFYVTNWMPDVSGVAIDPTSNIIYASSFINATNLFEFSLTNHAFLGMLKLGTAINGIQGLTVMGNMLVVSGHLEANVAEVWFFDKTGAEISSPEYLPQIGEIEDLSTYQSNLVATVGQFNYTFVPTFTTNLTARVGASGFKGKNLLLNSVSSVSSVLSRDPLDDGLVLCYHFDETGGQLVHDSSPSANAGWVITNSILGNAGVVGYGALFSTNAVYVNAMVANPDPLTGLTNMTINLWANSPTNFSAVRSLIDKHVQGTIGEWFIIANSCTNLQFSLINASQNRVNLSCNFPAGVAFTNNVWHMVTATYDGAEMNLYLDDNLLGSSSQTGVIQAIPGLQLGIGSYGATEVWNGGIDELKIWNRALSTNEISLLYNQVSNNKNFSSITGNGGGLTGLNATNLVGTISTNNLPAGTVNYGDGIAVTNNGTSTQSVGGNLVAPSFLTFSGGHGMTNISSGVGLESGGILNFGVGQNRILIRGGSMIGAVDNNPVSSATQGATTYITNSALGTWTVFTNLNVVGNVAAGSFIGNGGGLTNVQSGLLTLNTNAAPSNVTLGTTAPDFWITNVINGVLVFTPYWKNH